MRNYTKRDIYRLVEEEDVGFIRLQFTDIYGMMKNIAITTNQLEKALDNRCVFDGSSIEGFAKDEDSDMYLYPDLNTFEIFRGDHSRERLRDSFVMCIVRTEPLLRMIRGIF